MSTKDYTFKELIGRTNLEEIFEVFVNKAFPVEDVGDYIEMI